MLSLALTGCASIYEEPRTTLAVGGYHKTSVDSSFSSEAQSSQGLLINLEHEDGDGLLLTTHLAAHHSRIVSREPSDSNARIPIAIDEPVRRGELPPTAGADVASSHWLKSIGVGIGFFGKYVGGALGFHLVSGPQGSIEGNNGLDDVPFPMPWIEFRAGDLESGWATLRLGSKLSLNDGILAFLGGEFKGDHLRGSLGLGVIGNLFFEPGQTDLELDGGGMAGVGSVEWVSENGWGGSLRVTAGESYSIEAALVLELGKLYEDEAP